MLLALALHAHDPVDDFCREVWASFVALPPAQALLLALASGAVVALTGSVYGRTRSSTVASLGAIALVVCVLAVARLARL